MRGEYREIGVERANGRGFPTDLPPRDASLGELFARLSSDAQHLIRQEATLAKAELREAGARLARDAAKIAVAVALALLGAFSATAFLIIGLGALIGSYWASALIVTIVLLATAAILGKSAMNDLKEGPLKPEETIETLREDAEWAKREAQALKRDLTTPSRY
jgi:uncharacterized membrane protein YqjE